MLILFCQCWILQRKRRWTSSGDKSGAVQKSNSHPSPKGQPGRSNVPSWVFLLITFLSFFFSFPFCSSLGKNSSISRRDWNSTIEPGDCVSLVAMSPWRRASSAQRTASTGRILSTPCKQSFSKWGGWKTSFLDSTLGALSNHSRPSSSPSMGKRKSTNFTNISRSGGMGEALFV